MTLNKKIGTVICGVPADLEERSAEETDCRGEKAKYLDGAERCAYKGDCRYRSNGRPKFVGEDAYRVCCYPNIPGRSSQR